MNEAYKLTCEKTGLDQVIVELSRAYGNDFSSLFQSVFEAGYLSGEIAGAKQAAARLERIFNEVTY